MSNKNYINLINLYNEIYLCVSSIPVFETNSTNLLELCEKLKIDDLLGIEFKKINEAYTLCINGKMTLSSLKAIQNKLIFFLKKVENLTFIHFNLKRDWSFTPSIDDGVLKLHNKKETELKFPVNVDDEFKLEIKSILNDHPELKKFLV